MTLAVSIVGRNFTSLQVIIPVIVIVNALLFAPARGLVQRFVDRTFFRVQYHYRNTQRILLSRISECLSVQQLADTVVHLIEELLHPECLVFVLLSDEGSLHVLASRGRSVNTLTIDQIYDPSVFVAAYSLLGENGRSLGYLCCAQKKSGQRYTEEDIDLLVSVSTQSGAMLERFSLQEKIVLEQMESARLTELNELKSYFVSGVTHELKTPLTSIRMFAEMLQSQVSGEKAHKYLNIIQGESERLTRLINNVLDYSKIERGVKDYHTSVFDINEVVSNVVELMRYQIDINGFEFQVDLCRDDLFIKADRDALMEVIINLLSNALKYSAENKFIRIQTSGQKNSCTLSVEDHGIGIPADHLTDIFKPFIRLNDIHSARAGGAGLGLALVRHFADAHQAQIEVQSEVGKGTRINIMLQLSQPN
jgi:signal transduction histidine kinase